MAYSSLSLFTISLTLALFLASGCDRSRQSRSTLAAPAQPGITQTPALSGAGTSNHATCVERLRHLPKSAGFKTRMFKGGNRAQLQYLFFKPRSFQSNETYPLILSLHGGAPRRKFEHLLEPYLPGLAYGLGRLIAEETQTAQPSFVIAPWSDNRGWDDDRLQLVMELLQALTNEFRIDPRRRYVTGQSMGGFGTWAMLRLYPDYFAAAVPICGGGTPATVKQPWTTPVWAFHGTADRIVPVTHTREMVEAVRRVGGNPLYTEYQEADHAGTAERAYCEPELMPWLFRQRRP